MKTFILLLLIATLAIATRTVIQGNHRAPVGWKRLNWVEKTDNVRFTIVLKECNIQDFMSVFRSVTDPNNANYAQYLTLEEVNDITRCDRKDDQIILEYLSQFKHVTTEVIGHSIKVTTSIAVAEQIFETTFHQFEHSETKVKFVRQLGDVSLPDVVAQGVSIILGVSDFFHNTKLSAISYSLGQESIVQYDPNTDIISDPYITPNLLRKLYNIPQSANVTDPKLQVGIAAFTDDYDNFALCRFQDIFNNNANAPVVMKYGPYSGEDQIESDLDIQYSTGIARGVVAVFDNHPAGEWVLDWAISAVQNASKGPSVWSLSYGFPEIDQCMITNTSCMNYQQYIELTNVQLAKLGSMGITVTVSAGDDGSPGYSPNCPVDPKLPTFGTTCASTGLTECNCGGLTITAKSANGTLFCAIPQGLVYPSQCQELFDGALGIVLGDMLTTFIENSDKPNYCNQSLFLGNLFSPPFYLSNCTCQQLGQMVNESMGYTIEISGYTTYEPANGPAFAADYPTSSPYVTSVGATAVQWSTSQCSSNELVNKPEVYAAALDSSGYSGGGGFSGFQAQESYQTAAVSNYIKTVSQLPPDDTFDSSMRAYPDVAWNGHNFMVVLGESADEQGYSLGPDGGVQLIGGTSASSPSFAGMLILLNDALAKEKLPPVGFFNPMIYKMQSEDASTFNDIVPQMIGNITAGANTRCTQEYCCEYGFDVSTGWDPATGLGTPNFGKILAYMKKYWAHKKN